MKTYFRLKEARKKVNKPRKPEHFLQAVLHKSGLVCSTAMRRKEAEKQKEGKEEKKIR